MIEVSMLSRGKLVQDWRRKLAAAENETAEGPPHWIVRVQLRLYRFLVSCYGQTDWRADEPPPAASGETVLEPFHGDTTTLLDAPLGGKPAKSIGKMQAVLKAVSAAQEQPAAGPLVHGIAADDWVVVVSPRDKLKMFSCHELLKAAGIETSWGSQKELKVRYFDLERAAELIQSKRSILKTAKIYTLFPGVRVSNSEPNWLVYFLMLAFIVAPILSIWTIIFVEGFRRLTDESSLQKFDVLAWFGVIYAAAIVLGMTKHLFSLIKWRTGERRKIQRLVEDERMLDNRPSDGE